MTTHTPVKFIGTHTASATRLTASRCGESSIEPTKTLVCDGASEVDQVYARGTRRIGGS